MEGMSEREYSTHSGLSRGAIQKAKQTGRIVMFADGSINAAASDVRRAGTTDGHPEEERYAGRSCPGGNPGVPTGPAGARCLGDVARPRGSPDGSTGGNGDWGTGGDSNRDYPEGSGNPCLRL
jgi:hypothetical protein